jgi:thiamine-phosphate pyrophosphorylase
MPPVLRLLDANANRAREALRVMEDAARFLLDHAELQAGLKILRHDLAEAVRDLPELATQRDTPGDVGTTVTTPSEQTRAGAADVVRAAGKRLSEALRSLEEYAKVLPPPAGPTAAARFEALRYRGYTLEQRLNAALAGGRARQWRLCVLLTESLCRLPWREVLDQVLGAGADCVQLREKSLEDGELLHRAGHVAERCRAHGAAAIVNDRPDIALLAGADGVHLGQTDLPPREVRKLTGTQLLIGVSTSNLAEARAAKAAGVDYVGLGPMFPTTTKHKPVLAGPAYLREYLADKTLGALPHLAIGGIGPDNLLQLIDAGVCGIAVSWIACATQEPADIVCQLSNCLPRHRAAGD